MTPFHVAAGRLPLSGLQAEYFTAEGEEDLCERPGADWSLTRRAMCVEKAIGAAAAGSGDRVAAAAGGAVSAACGALAGVSRACRGELRSPDDIS